MAIRIDTFNLKKISNVENIIFTDLSNSFYIKPYKENKDIIISNDLEAIKNELNNLFNRNKYSLILSPEIGFDLNGFIGQPVTQSFAEMQRQKIVNLFLNSSNRFNLTELDIRAIPEHSLFHIKIEIELPMYNKKHTLESVIKDGQFIFI